MGQGHSAVAARRYADAVRSFGEALKVRPGDPAALKAQKEAQQALDASRVPPKPPVKPMPPPAPKPPAPAKPVVPAPAQAPAPNPAVEPARQMRAGAALEKGGRWGEAVAAYEGALRWVPNEPKATAALRNASFQLHLANGRKAHAARRFAEAAREYEEALKLQPANAEVKGLLG